MPVVERTIEIHAERGALFDLTQDYDRRLSWDPFLKEARLMGLDPRPSLGARAWCVAKNGLAMETEYVAYHPPAVVAVKMTRGPAVFKSFAGSWRFERVAEGRTRLTFRYHFEVEPKWLRWLLEPLFTAIFLRETVGRLEALRRAVEIDGILAIPAKP
jgi:ribosome-associated toxin RatA of RatAB toxin-antitoxin module